VLLLFVVTLLVDDVVSCFFASVYVTCLLCSDQHILGHFIKKDPFGLDRTLGLVLICMNFWSDNKRLVLSCRLSETSG